MIPLILSVVLSAPQLLVSALPASGEGPWGLGPQRELDQRTVCVVNVEPGSYWNLSVEWESEGVKHEVSSLRRANEYGQACETWYSKPDERGDNYEHRAVQRGRVAELRL